MTNLHDRRTIVVSGAGGYIGRHVVAALADRGFDVVAIVREDRSDLDARARVVVADILDAELAFEGIIDDRTEAFIHLAWQDGFTHNAQSHMMLLSAHYALLRRVAAAGVPRIAVLGTMHEVGYWEGAIQADTPTQPRTLYGIAKDALRRAVFVGIDDVEVAWLRCYYIYGDDRRSQSIFAKLLAAADAGQETFPFTSGKNRYDFIRVEDLGRQIAVAATTPGVTGVINCSTGEPVSLADKVEQFIAEHDLPIRLEYGAFPDRPYDSPGVWGDAQDIRRIMATAG